MLFGWVCMAQGRCRIFDEVCDSIVVLVLVVVVLLVLLLLMLMLQPPSRAMGGESVHRGHGGLVGSERVGGWVITDDKLRTMGGRGQQRGTGEGACL